MEGDLDVGMVAADAVEYCVGRIEWEDDEEMFGFLGAAAHGWLYWSGQDCREIER